MNKENMNFFEEEAYKEGKSFILGIDEVGRGPLAGDVTVAGVILDKDNLIKGLNDSKKLSEKKRNLLAKEIKEKAVIYDIVSIDAPTIDEIGISNAIRKAVYILIDNISKKVKIDKILIDYMKIELEIEHEILKKGDSRSNSIAAASIIAKVNRDAKMVEISSKYADYGFDKNKGYGTKTHIEAIKKYGIIKGIHRISFEPIKTFLKE